MTNTEIILAEMATLIAEGVISADDTIHTYDHWAKAHGLYVKKGEHAVAKFPIWKYKAGKRKEGEVNDDEEDVKDRAHCFMGMACWFTDKQVVTKEEFEKLYGFDPTTKRKKKRK